MNLGHKSGARRPTQNRIARNGLQTTNNIVAPKQLFPLRMGATRTQKPTMLWFTIPAPITDFWRLDHVILGSQNRLPLCVSKRFRKHAGFWWFSPCLALPPPCSPYGYRCSFSCCFFLRFRFFVIQNAMCRQIQIQRVSAQVEMSRTVTQVAVSKP